MAVPGDVRGYYEAWNKFGRLPWSDLFQPAIQRCEEGFIVEKDLSKAIKQYEEVMYSDPNFRLVDKMAVVRKQQIQIACGNVKIY